MKKALITGINGMDGSHMADFLLERDMKFMEWKEELQVQIELTLNTYKIR